ncbi:MAG: hypothetical protein LQ349_006660 [Xanthoria aureola]|nr:MAG: hypothetical protein LQ349_006660 [Xanthoria aureola]
MVEATMMFYLIILFSIIANVKARPSSRPLRPLVASLEPTCFPTRPYCIRPQVNECRDAIVLMAGSDPGYPLILGRTDAIKHESRAYDVPRKWASIPPNCVVKIDVRDPQTTVETTLKIQASWAEVVVKKCIIKGTGCGGAILTGATKYLELTVGYYTAVEIESLIMLGHPNVTNHLYDDV